MGLEWNGDSDDLKAFLEKTKKDMDSHKSYVNALIDPWISKLEALNLSSKIIDQKKKELIDLGSFIQVYNSEIRILDALCERPDFIVELDGEIIGIELTDVIVNLEAKKKEGTYKKLFDGIEKKLSQLGNHYKGIYRITFNSNAFKLDQNSRQIIEEDIIQAVTTNSTPKSNYISTIRKSGSVALISLKMNLVVFLGVQAANERKVLNGVFLASMI
jgi:hypothetical protein